MSDSEFFREVDEAVRQEQYKKLWDKYGVYALILAALLVMGVAGYKTWNYWRDKEAGLAGAQFTDAMIVDAGGDAAKARETFAKLSESGPAGYRVLSRLQLAAADAKAGNKDKAVAAYDALASDSSVDKVLQDYASIQAATIRTDSADFAEMERRLKTLAEGNSPWKGSARELLGLSAYKNNKLDEAEKQFSALIADPASTDNLRDRANLMLALIAGANKASSNAAN
jgi:hypothetical protein